ncbi:hypothetical protein Goarm_001094, partial [Gossypium armourianum]|nr:hypothetical protein [Gossypium armourianum]
MSLMLTPSDYKIWLVQRFIVAETNKSLSGIIIRNDVGQGFRESFWKVLLVIKKIKSKVLGTLILDGRGTGDSRSSCNCGLGRLVTKMIGEAGSEMGRFSLVSIDVLALGSSLGSI